MPSQKHTHSQKIILEIFNKFHDPKYLEWDPLTVIRRFQGSRHQEFLALISALFAFGAVKQIIASVEKVVKALELESDPDLRSWTSENLFVRLRGFKHRIYVDRDVVVLALLYQKTVLEFGSLEKHFRSHQVADDETVESGLRGVIEDYKSWAKGFSFRGGPHFKHMLNSPEDGSTCKRWLMLLKWYIRPNDGIDLGLWKNDGLVRRNQLLIPLDTHLFKISKRLKLTKKATANWKTSVEVTKNLKKLDADDPTKFDFSMCRLGMFEYRKKI